MTRQKLRLRLRRWFGILLRAFSPGWGRCYHCGWPWCHVKEHQTKYTFSSGCFPLCERCWRGLSIAERRPYYVQMLRKWDEPMFSETWNAVMKAVNEGK